MGACRRSCVCVTFLCLHARCPPCYYCPSWRSECCGRAAHTSGVCVHLLQPRLPVHGVGQVHRPEGNLLDPTGLSAVLGYALGAQARCSGLCHLGEGEIRTLRYTLPPPHIVFGSRSPPLLLWLRVVRLLRARCAESVMVLLPPPPPHKPAVHR
jgi:hypothetical protein